MADSETQQVTAYREAYEKLLAEANALIANSRQRRAEREANSHREAHEKLLAEANALIANIRQRRAEREALAEANSHREANAPIARQRRADAPSREAHKKAEPFLTTAQWLSVIYLAASLAGF